jgi:hypothetical protein
MNEPTPAESAPGAAESAPAQPTPSKANAQGPSPVIVATSAATTLHFRLAQAVWQTVLPSRFAIGAVIVVTAILFGVEQGREALRLMVERLDFGSGLVFLAALTLCAHNAWYFPRVLLRFQYPGKMIFDKGSLEETWQRAMVAGLPRVLGALPFVTTALGLLLLQVTDSSRKLRLLAVVVLAGVVCGAFVWARRWLFARLHDKYEGVWQTVKWMAPDVEPPLPNLRALKELGLGPGIWLGLQLLLWLVLVLVFVAAPVWAGQGLSSPTVLLLAGGSWITIGSAVTYLGEWTQVPALTLIVLWSFFCSHFNDNHRVLLDVRHAPRPNLSDDFAGWRAGHSDQPWFFVATEGGGIRAAFWTVTVLGALEQQSPGFSHHLYGISSVSGGSVGAGMFVATLASGRTGTDAKRVVREAMSVDSLGPVLGKGLFSDSLQRYLPFSCPQLDRGIALEQSWTQSFLDAASQDQLSRGFNSMYAPEASVGPLPRLFLNSTWVESGKRVVISYPSLDGSRDGRGPTLATALDFERELGTPTLAQAMHLSARFTLVSPAAKMSRPNAPAETWGHLVDGGYFENSGAATALDVLNVLAPPGSHNPPFVIVIRFDSGPVYDAPIGWVPELLSPIQTILKTRDARADEALAGLKTYANGRYVEFLLNAQQDIPLPLGWVLSEQARAEMEAEIHARDAYALRRVTDAVRASTN